MKSQSSTPRLKHDKRIYRLWFEFLKRAYQADVVVDQKICRDWGDVLNTPFKEWWERHWVDLFSEQESAPRILSGDRIPKSKNSTRVYLEIPINKPITTVLDEIKDVIKPCFDQHRVGRKGAFPSTAKFQITTGAEIRIESFRMILRCYHLKQQGVRTKDIPDGIRTRIMELQSRQRKDGRRLATEGVFASDEEMNINRYAQRYVKQAKTIIKNVASGEFPGKY